MERGNYYYIEWFNTEDNSWIFEPERRHRNLENAVNNAELLRDSKQCPVRVIHDGKIINQMG